MEVATLIREFASLAPERRSEVAALIAEFPPLDAERRAEVASIIREFAALAPERHEEVWGGYGAVPVVPPPGTTTPAPGRGDT